MSNDRIESLFRKAIAITEERRKKFVLTMSRGQTTLQNQVLSLVTAYSQAGGFMDEPVVKKPEGEDFHDEEMDPGQRIDRYIIGNQIGVGGMGAVYLAHQVEPVQRDVALKIVRPGMDSRSILARFARERQALAMMNHPGIAAVLDAGSTPLGRPYFVMEYVEGPPITQYCNEHRLPIEERLKLFTTVCYAVHHAHQRGIIHRDLKPSNILVAGTNDPQPRVIDFGIAKTKPEFCDQAPFQTRVGITMGTPEYMSPEQACVSPTKVDARTDVYSLGVLLYELLVGALPDCHRNPSPPDLETAQRAAVLTQEPSKHFDQLGDSKESVAQQRHDHPRELGKKLRGDLDAILLKALEPDPNKRYMSCLDLASDVVRFGNGDAVTARAPSIVYRFGRILRRNRTLFIAITSVIALLALGLTIVSVLLLQVRHERNLMAALSDAATLELVVTEGDKLWPAEPENVAAMDQWLAGASRDLIERLPTHRKLLESRRAEAPSIGPHGKLLFDNPRKQFDYHQLENTVAKIETFANSKNGYYAGMVQRREDALSIVGRSIESYAVQWQEAIVAISQNEQYNGLKIIPQVGLVPIGPDPLSGLWEFAHVPTGKVPGRSAQKDLLLTDSTGLIFILIPAGEFLMGSARLAESTEPGGTVDTEARDNEQPAHRVSIGAPFFISKYEMTQAQWQRISGDNPSRFRAGELIHGIVISPMHPVERVDWYTAVNTLNRLRLVLPTEAQWEYVGRAGTTSRFFSGSSLASLEGYANIADLDYYNLDGSKWLTPVPWHDGYPNTSPIGSFLPNPWGLHDTMGNVIESCRDAGALFNSVDLDPLDGFRSGGEPENAAMRSGYWRHPDGDLERSSRRVVFSKTKKEDIGVRPVRELQMH